METNIAQKARAETPHRKSICTAVALFRTKYELTQFMVIHDGVKTNILYISKIKTNGNLK